MTASVKGIYLKRGKEFIGIGRTAKWTEYQNF
jgi:hypothetical protein